MNKRLLISSLFSAAILGSLLYSQTLIDARAASFAAEKTLVLYETASGAIPSETLLDFTDFPPGTAAMTFSGDAAVMDTGQSGMDTYAGWVAGRAINPGFPILDRAAGAQVNFTLRVESEMHNSDHRAGFSLILLDQDAQGIELAFWENEIWAQNDDRTGGLFTHGEGIAFATTADQTDYQLTFAEDTYTLFANSQILLSGPLRDYSNFDGFPDPYETPNFLFIGDDTTAAGARIRLRFVSVTGLEPELSAITSTSSPQPVASSTPLPGATLVPAPAPAGTVSPLCCSGWLFLAVTMTGALINNGIRRRINHS